MLSYSVTVIVPVYNGEDYVKDCFYQLKEQSLSDIEVIFVNDGSTDSTQSKLQELIKGNDNFKLINQKNGGVSNARNVGVSQAKGKYIGFVDVDDIYDKDMYEILYNNACENNLDLISMDKIGNFHELTILNRSEAIKKFLMSDIGMSACFKLFRKKIFDTVQFPLGVQIYEDCYTDYYSLKVSNNIGILNTEKYHYIRREGSNSRAKLFEKKYFGAIDVVNEICKDVLNDDKSLEFECLRRKASTYLRITKIYYMRGAPKQYQKDIESIISYLNNLTLSEKFKCFSNFNFIRLILLLHCLPLFKLLISTIDCK